MEKNPEEYHLGEGDSQSLGVIHPLSLFLHTNDYIETKDCKVMSWAPSLLLSSM